MSDQRIPGDKALPTGHISRRQFGSLILAGAALPTGLFIHNPALASTHPLAGVLFGIASNLDMRWHKDLNQMGGTDWAPNSGAKVGHGWSFPTLIAGEGGTIFGIAATGKLYWYQYRGNNGQFSWAPGAGSVVGSGWHNFTHIAHGGDNILYAVRPNGDLLWYKYIGQNGTFTWHPNSGSKIGHGFNFRQIVGGGDGVLYCVTHNHDLLWYRDRAQDGTRRWDTGSSNKIGNGWSFESLLSTGDGTLYGVTASGRVYWYQDIARDGRRAWHPNTGSLISTSFPYHKAVAAFHNTPTGLGGGAEKPIEGYVWPVSARPGEQISIYASTGAVTYSATFHRVGSATTTNQNPTTATSQSLTNLPGLLQETPPDAWRDGCDWQSNANLVIPADWTSGMYAVELADSNGRTHWISFAVKPTAPPSTGSSQRFAVLANINTWNAYNNWGGRSNYTSPNGVQLSFLRPSTNGSPIDSTPNRVPVPGTPNTSTNGYQHLIISELWGHRWLNQQGFDFDLYSDLDLHNGDLILDDYAGLILLAHPEYWTTQMFDRTQTYLQQTSGKLYYLGGNGIYESCDYPVAPETMQLRNGVEGASRSSAYFDSPAIGRPEAALTGVAYEGDNYLTFAPYAVQQPNHRFFNGTGIAQNDLFGNSGLMGAASGWEMDAVDEPHSPANIEVLARGTNELNGNNFAAEMTYYETLGGGFVFSAGSLTITGALESDPVISQVVRNALEAAAEN